MELKKVLPAFEKDPGYALFFDRAQHSLPQVIVVSGESPDVADPEDAP